jgi:hypothetical protein
VGAFQARIVSGVLLVSRRLAKSIARKELPVRSLIAVIVAGCLMVVWYLVVIALLIRAYSEADAAVPAFLTSLVAAIGLTDGVTEIVKNISAAPVVLFLLGLAGLGILDRMANLSAFAKAYVQDNAIGEGAVGLRVVLDHVHARNFDEVYVVAHSFGGAIAVDALAEYGKPLSKTVLHTWGTAMGIIVQQEPPDRNRDRGIL